MEAFRLLNNLAIGLKESYNLCALCYVVGEFILSKFIVLYGGEGDDVGITQNKNKYTGKCCAVKQ